MKPLATAFALLLTLSSSALPLTWRADWPDCKPVESLVHRGTDVELQPTWYVNGAAAATNGWTFTTYVQTNAVGQWFGPLPGAAFSHTNDVGAAFYSVMVRAQGADGGVNYTAFARFRMLDSPGFTPGELPLPAKTIDFADVTVLNAPWPDASITNGFVKASVTNGLASASSLANYATRAQLESGWWSEWEFTGLPAGWHVVTTEYEGSDRWFFYAAESIVPEGAWGYADGGEDATTLLFANMETQEYGILNVTATRHRVAAPVPTKPEDIGAADSNTVASISADLATNYYTIAETDDAIDALAAYYITMNAEGDAFPDYAALTNTAVYYSGGEPRTPTRNDYAVVLADETHGTNEWRYIYTVSVVGGVTNGQWDAQYPIETNDYEALSNKPQINGHELSGDVTAAELGLPTMAATAGDVANIGWSFVLTDNVSFLTNEIQEVVGGVTNVVTTVETNSYTVLSLYRDGTLVWTSDPAEQGIGWIVALVLALLGGGGGLIWKFVAPLASPAFTGTPTAPTAASGTNTTQIATTEFVQTVAATKADAAALRYAANAATVPTGATPTVTGIADRAMNSATLGSGVTAADITLPAATAGYARDFFVFLAIEASDAPTLTFTDPATNADVAIAFGEESLADIDVGNNLILFTEVLPGSNKFLVSVKHEAAS